MRNTGLLPDAPASAPLTDGDVPVLPDAILQTVVVTGESRKLDTALGNRKIDKLAVGAGEFAIQVSKEIDSRPWLKAGLIALDVAAGPVAFAVRETIAASPIGTAIEAVQSRIQEEVSGRFERAGWTGEEALAGGVGAMAVTGLAVGGAKMLVKGVRGVMAKLRGGRNEHFTSVDAFARATNDPSPNTTYHLNDIAWKTDRLGRLEG